jgi:hypothetical protein
VVNRVRPTGRSAMAGSTPAAGAFGTTLNCRVVYQSQALLLLARVGCAGTGGAIPLRSDSSDINLFGYGKSIMDLDAKIADRALNPLVPQQKLYCSQVAGPAVDEGGFGSAQ